MNPKRNAPLAPREKVSERKSRNGNMADGAGVPVFGAAGRTVRDSIKSLLVAFILSSSRRPGGTGDRIATGTRTKTDVGTGVGGGAGAGPGTGRGAWEV